MTAFSVPANFAFDSFDKLVTAISDWMDRNDLEGSAGQMIALAEARMDRELSPYLAEQSIGIDLLAGVGALPADMGTPLRVIYNGRALYQRGRAVYSTDLMPSMKFEGGQIVVAPADDYTVTLLYIPRLTKLSGAQQTSDLLDQQPDLYFYGAMMFAEGFVANDGRASMFKALWDEALDSAKQYLLSRKYVGPLVPRLAS